MRLAVRTEALLLTRRVASAAVAAGGGAAMALDAPAQRLARTALCLLVQAQSAAGRRATLAALAGGEAAGAT